MALAPVPGPVRFARYAYGPNRLGYCGPDAADELLGEAAEGGDLRRIRELATGFEGAYPYLKLIAQSNGLVDPLDERVVEAYWLGGELLGRVPVRAFGASVEMRFRPRLRRSDWRWLATKAPVGAHPVHAFHVLDVFPVAGFLRGEGSGDILHTIDSCRIRWGTVRDRIGGDLLVDAVPLEWRDGKLQPGAPRAEPFAAWQDASASSIPRRLATVCRSTGTGPANDSTTRQRANLQAWTDRELAIANRTI